MSGAPDRSLPPDGPAVGVALFAYNEARHLPGAIQALREAAAHRCVTVAVLLNGCTDDSLAVARRLASEWPAIELVEIPLADKANAWNVYVHRVSVDARFAGAPLHLFVDADVRVGPRAVEALARALDDVPSANAAGGMPLTGRDRDAWRQRMMSGGTLAGNLYALRGAFVSRLRGEGIRLPVGLIGEDWLVSWLARMDLQPGGPADGLPRLVFAPDAGFSFRSLSPLRPRDYRTYARRLWRYALRGVQFEMLAPLLRREPPSALPRDVDELYRRAGIPSRLKWIGRSSLLRTLAVQQVRRKARRARLRYSLDS